MSAGMVASAGTVAACALLGTVVGAFTPRIAYRLSVPPEQPPRPACLTCARPFPVGLAGWVRPGRCCPGCSVRTGPSPWLAVPAAAVSCALLGWALGPAAALPAYLVMAGIGVVLAFVDLACLRLPDPLVAAAFLLAGGWLTGLAILDGAWTGLVRALLAALGSGVAYLVLAVLPGAHLGLGDVKLAAVLGFLLGWLGWPAAVLGLALPHLLNGPVVLGLLLARRVGWRSNLPFGPALLAGALFAVVLSTRPPS